MNFEFDFEELDVVLDKEYGTDIYNYDEVQNYELNHLYDFE